MRSSSFNPLSLHPPLALNASPAISESSEDIHHGSSRYGQFRHTTGGLHEYGSEQSPSSGNFYFNQDSRRRTYVYDQHLQWPLKDWQTVPPGLADMSEAEVYRHTKPRTLSTPSHRRPPREVTSDLDMFVKVGAWKRRGIVFELDSDSELDQVQHFELPE
ncbi:hypothetical protein BX600DRAFT_465133 [Xylariales sp. PMI_506]|nr:hypothetical protein BX600DRAFT_465133 [Xylariales sp. PMI_506]